MTSEDVEKKRNRLEIERLESEIALNKAQVKKLGNRGIIKFGAILVGIMVTIAVFAASFTGFLADISEISKKELPAARKELNLVRDRNIKLDSTVESLKHEKQRADSLQIHLQAALATLYVMDSSHSSLSDYFVNKKISPPWLFSLILIKIDKWDGPLLVALHDKDPDAGFNVVTGLRFHSKAILAQEMFGSWSPFSSGIRIEENVGGLLVGDHSTIYIDLTKPSTGGGFSARWESHLGKGVGVANRVGSLSGH